MDSVIATGKYYGETITVIVSKENEDMSITFNGVQNLFLQRYIEYRIEELPFIGGTYRIRKTELLGWYFVLKEKFFEKLIHIVVEGELETIPFEDGVIY